MPYTIATCEVRAAQVSTLPGKRVVDILWVQWNSQTTAEAVLCPSCCLTNYPGVQTVWLETDSPRATCLPSYARLNYVSLTSFGQFWTTSDVLAFKIKPDCAFLMDLYQLE